jgi:hypothetical protein
MIVSFQEIALACVFTLPARRAFIYSAGVLTPAELRMIMPRLTSITRNPKPETFGRPKAVGAGVLPAKVFFLLGLKRCEAREAVSPSVSPPASPTSGKVAPSHHCPLRRYESSKQATKAAEANLELGTLNLKLFLTEGFEPHSNPARDAVKRVFVQPGTMDDPSPSQNLEPNLKHRIELAVRKFNLLLYIRED